MTDKPISGMTTNELLALIKEADSELWKINGMWVSKNNNRKYFIVKNLGDHITFSYVDGWGNAQSGVSTKQAFLENYTRYKDIKNG